MLRFSRSEIAPADPKVQIVDGPAAKAWLAGMAQPATRENLAEITQVLYALGAQGAEESVAMQPRRKFAIADRVRATILPLLTATYGEDRFKVLPVDDEVARHFWAVAEAALALRDVYAWLVSQLPKAPAAIDVLDSEEVEAATATVSAVSATTALHRALDLSAFVLVAIQRGHWAVPPALWDRHCVLGQLVRDLDCQDVDTVDALRLSATKTCRAAFVFPILVALADPAARSGPEFEVARMGAQRWSARVGFRLERQEDGAPPPQRPVSTPGPTVVFGATVVRFDTQSMLHSIDKRIAALNEGLSPREAGIGDLLRAPTALELLASLKQRWGAKTPQEIDSPDRAWRASNGLSIVVAVGMPSRDGPTAASHGIPPSGRSTYKYQRSREGAITQTREELDRARVEQLFERAETWSIVAESPDAIRCIRKHPRPRIGLSRLVSLRMGSDQRGTAFLLGWVEALQGSTTVLDDGIIRSTSAHQVRVRLAPGVPQLLQASADDLEIEAAFLLVPGGDADAGRRAGRVVPFVPMLSDSGLRNSLVVEDGDGWDNVRRTPRDYGLVLPHACFRPQRVIKATRQGAFAMLRLEELMMRGSDFDLVRFTPL
jgi:hypothetical protein